MAANAAKAKTAKAKAVKPKTKRVKAIKTPAAKENAMHATESQTFSCDDMEEDSRTLISHPGMKPTQKPETDILVSREESWETQGTLVKIQATSPFVYCEIRHTSPIKYRVWCEGEEGRSARKEGEGEEWTTRYCSGKVRTVKVFPAWSSPAPLSVYRKAPS